MFFVGDPSIVSTRRGPGIPKLFIVRDLSLDSLRTSGFLPVGYILSLAQRATREENGTALFSTGKSHVRAGRILRLSAKKVGEKGEGGERDSFYPGPSLFPSKLSGPGRTTLVSRLSLDREKNVSATAAG